MDNSNLYFRTFLLLLATVTAAFIWVLLPYYAAIFWGVILAIVFTPMHKRLLARMTRHPSLAALTTVAIIVLIVIIPLILVSGLLVQEGTAIYKQISSGQLNLGANFEQIINALPVSVHDTLDRLGVGDILSLRDKLSAGAMAGSKFLASQAVSFGQHTFEFMLGLGIMLYLLFFLLRDGSSLARKSKQVIPLSQDHQQHLFRKFTTVVRATVKGNIVVAATQGALGGLIFWFLGIQGALFWGVLMAFLSLLPAIGAALIWVPVALFFLVSGAIWQGVVLTVFCVVVIGLVDNALRPMLVGKDTKMPDYVILISTLGGMATFGLNGFVIGPLFAALFISCWDLFPAAIHLNQKK